MKLEAQTGRKHANSMAKKNKAPKTPEIYAGLDTTKAGTELCLVLDKHGQLFKFDNSSLVTIVSDGIANKWPSWDVFEKACSNDKLMLDTAHNLAFSAPVPAKTDVMTASLMIWKKWLLKAADRTDAGNPINIEKRNEKGAGGQSKIATRKYRLGVCADKPEVVSAIVTPQAKVCFAILREAIKQRTDVNAADDSISETDLKACVNSRAPEIKTRQDPWRIFQYYRPTLIASKLIAHD